MAKICPAGYPKSGICYYYSNKHISCLWQNFILREANFFSLSFLQLAEPYCQHVAFSKLGRRLVTSSPTFTPWFGGGGRKSLTSEGAVDERDPKMGKEPPPPFLQMSAALPSDQCSFFRLVSSHHSFNQQPSCISSFPCGLVLFWTAHREYVTFANTI